MNIVAESFEIKMARDPFLKRMRTLKAKVVV